MRIGDIHKGPRGGRIEVESWDWDREAEIICEQHDDVDCTVYRSAWVLVGKARRRRGVSLDKLGDLVTEGAGYGPPWEWVKSGERWVHPDGRWFEYRREDIWELYGCLAYRGTGHPSTFAAAEVSF